MEKLPLKDVVAETTRAIVFDSELLIAASEDNTVRFYKWKDAAEGYKDNPSTQTTWSIYRTALLML